LGCGRKPALGSSSLFMKSSLWMWGPKRLCRSSKTCHRFHARPINWTSAEAGGRPRKERAKGNVNGREEPRLTCYLSERGCSRRGARPDPERGRAPLDADPAGSGRCLPDPRGDRAGDRGAQSPVLTTSAYSTPVVFPLSASHTSRRASPAASSSPEKKQAPHIRSTRCARSTPPIRKCAWAG